MKIFTRAFTYLNNIWDFPKKFKFREFNPKRDELYLKIPLGKIFFTLFFFLVLMKYPFVVVVDGKTLKIIRIR